MKKNRQEYIEVNGVSKAICPICKLIIVYPGGVYLRNGIEVHINCVARARLREFRRSDTI
jgi:hypothetical protein